MGGEQHYNYYTVTGRKCYDFDGSHVMAARPYDKGT
jgi:hypothetical protein